MLFLFGRQNSLNRHIKELYLFYQNQLDFGLDLSRCWEVQASTAKGDPYILTR